MSRIILIAAVTLMIAAVMMTTAGCGGSITPSSGASDSGSSSQAAAQPAGTGQQGQQPQQGQGNQGAGQRGPGVDNTKLLARVAAILNVPVDKLTTAFNNALPKRAEGDKSGTPPSGAAPTGTPPSGTPPTGSGNPPTGTPPAGGQPGQPGQFTLPDDVIEKISSELGLPADTVSSAFEQAMTELQSSSTSR